MRSVPAAKVVRCLEPDAVALADRLELFVEPVQIGHGWPRQPAVDCDQSRFNSVQHSRTGFLDLPDAYVN